MPQEIVDKLESLVAKICAEQDFQTRMGNIPLQMMHENSATYEKSLLKFKDDILAFFKEEGLVK